jgi:hypothetical protein
LPTPLNQRLLAFEAVIQEPGEADFISNPVEKKTIPDNVQVKIM